MLWYYSNPLTLYVEASMHCVQADKITKVGGVSYTSAQACTQVVQEVYKLETLVHPKLKMLCTRA